MAIQAPTNDPTVNLSGASTKNDPTLDRDRVRVRAAEIRRQRLVLENELGVTRESDAARDFLQSRIQTLSNEEDALAPKLADAERRLKAEQQQQLQTRQVTMMRQPQTERPQSIPAGQAQFVAEAVKNDLIQDLEQQNNQQRIIKQQENEDVAKNRKAVKAPNKFLYFPLIYIAVVVDLLALFDLTGIGAIVVFVLNVIASIFFFFVSLYLGRKIKRVGLSGKKVQKIVANVERRVILYRRRIATVIRLARKTNTGKSILRSSVGRKTVEYSGKLLKWTRIPIVRSIAAYVLELIPFINMMPWYTINMVLTYREHSKEYRTSLEVLEQYAPVSVDEQDAFGEYQEAQVEEGIAVIDALAQGNVA